MSDVKLLPKLNLPANFCLWLGTYFWTIPIGLIFASQSASWDILDTTGKAGVIFFSMSCGSNFFNIFALLDHRLDIWTVVFGWIYMTVAVSITTAKKIPFFYTGVAHWPFGFMWAGWCFTTVHLFMSLPVNIMFLNKNGWKKCEKKYVMPNTRNYKNC